MHILQFWAEHLIQAGIWVSLALSLNLINGYTGLFSLGHQGFWGLGAYTTAILLTVLPAHYPQLEAGGWLPWLFLLSFPASMLTAAIFGFLVGVPCLRLRGDYLAIATLGFGQIFSNICNDTLVLGTAQGLSIPNVVRGVLEKETQDINTLRWAVIGFYFILSWAIVLGTLLIMRNLLRSAHGRAIEAIREDETAAELQGVNLARYKVMVFVIGAALAGLAGALYANCMRYISPKQFDLMAGINLLAIVVLGGMGSMTGTIIAAFLIYFIPVLLSNLPDSVSVPVFYDLTQSSNGWVYRQPKDLWMVIFSFLLIVVIIWKPEGLMGRREWSPLAWWKRRQAGAAATEPPRA